MRARGPLLVGAALRSGPLRVAGLFALVAFVVPSAAHAQSTLAGADRAYDEGQLREAARAYDDAIASGGLDPAALLRAHLRLGVLSALGGELDRTDRHFAVALSLDPTRDAPEELSPELRARFVALREARDGRRIALELERDGGAIVVRVRDAPEGLARAIELSGGRWRARLAWDGEPMRVEPPAEALPIEAVLLDEHDNRLARAGARTTTAALIEPAGAPAEATGGRNLLESPWLWIAVGAIVIGIGLAIGVSASGDRYLLQPPVVR